MAFSVDEFVGDILKDISVSDTNKQALLEVVKNPTVAKRLEESALRQSDYSKKIQEQKDLLKKTQDYWDGLTTWKTDKEREFAETEKLLKKRLIDEGVDVGGKDKGEVTRESLNELANQSVLYQNTITRLGMQYLKDFNEVIDTDELMKIANSNRVNISQAYDLYTKPKREEIQKSEFDKAIAKAREEGKEEAVKNFSLPVTEQAQNLNSVPSALDRLKNGSGAGDKFGVSAAVSAFNENMRRGKRASSDGF